MADGEVEVSVKADGVEDAAGEMGGDAAGAGGGGGGGGGGADVGGGKKGGKGSLLGKTLTRILGLIAFLGPILKVVGVVSDVLTAFVAPLAILLFRLLQPLLVLALKLLPLYLTFFEKLNDVVDWLAKLRDAIVTRIMAGVEKLGGWLTALPGKIKAFVKNLPDRIGTFIDNVTDKVAELPGRIGTFIDNVTDEVKDLPKRIWSFLKKLPSQIGDKLADALPDFSGIPGVGGDGDGLLSGVRDFLDGDGDGGGGGDGPIVNIGGGLAPFVDSITDSDNYDLP